MFFFCCLVLFGFVLFLSLASENTFTRADYMSTGSVMLYESGDESTRVHLSPGAKHQLVRGSTHSAQKKCIVACLIKILHVNCVIAGVIHL